MPRKRTTPAKLAERAEYDSESEIVLEAVKEEAEEEDTKPKKKRIKKEKEPANEEPHVALEGPKWTIHPPWLMYRLAAASASAVCAHLQGM